MDIEAGTSFTSANTYFVFLWRDAVVISRVLEDRVLLVVHLCHQAPCRYRGSRPCKHALTTLLKRHQKTLAMLLLSSQALHVTPSEVLSRGRQALGMSLSQGRHSTTAAHWQR